MRRKITQETWDQIKTAYAAGVGLGEIARKMNIPEGTVLAHAKRHGWTQQIQVATQPVSMGTRRAFEHFSTGVSSLFFIRFLFLIRQMNLQNRG
jgi:hypothetical protein